MRFKMNKKFLVEPLKKIGSNPTIAEWHKFLIVKVDDVPGFREWLGKRPYRVISPEDSRFGSELNLLVPGEWAFHVEYCRFKGVPSWA
jgi:hypothetical protein